MDENVRHTTTVEFEGGLEGDALLGGGGLGVSSLGGVEGVDVGLVVLSVVEGHDFLGDEGLEGIIRIREFGEFVCHCGWWLWWLWWLLVVDELDGNDKE